MISKCETQTVCHLLGHCKPASNIQNFTIHFSCNITVCKTEDVKVYGYDTILQQLLAEMETLEQEGVFVQKLGASISGTVLYMSADNLGAHFLKRFLESLSIDKLCKFCLAGHEEIQTHEVRDGRFQDRTVESHEKTLFEIQKNQDSQAINDVKRDCVLNRLAYFITLKGFPPSLKVLSLLS